MQEPTAPEDPKTYLNRLRDETRAPIAMTRLPDEVYFRFAAALERSERLPRAALDAARHDLLTRLVTFAHNHSPFYRGRLDPLISTAPRVALEAWNNIPILHRAELQAALDRINPSWIPPEAGPIFSLQSSGSTGAPVALRTCLLSQVASECMIHRLYRWHGIDLSAPLASVRYYGSHARVYPDGLIEERWSYLGPLAPHYSLDLRHPADQVIDWLVRRQPRYLMTTPSMAYDLAIHPDAHLVRDLRLLKIFAVSEGTDDYTRRIVGERLGAEMAQFYACSEAGCLALQSPDDDQLLVCEETVLLELVDERDAPVDPGEPGRVLVTSLYNYATPLIRYDTGDYATWSDIPCPSGRPLRRLRRVNGRMRNGLITADGVRMWPHQIPVEEILRLLSASHVQIRQPEARKIELDYVAAPDTSAPDRQSLNTLFAKLLGDLSVVSIHRVRSDLALCRGQARTRHLAREMRSQLSRVEAVDRKALT